MLKQACPAFLQFALLWLVYTTPASGCAIDPAIYLRLFKNNWPMFKEMTRLVKESGAATVLDIGTGPGEPGIMMAQNLPNVKVSAVDVNPGMIEKAKGRAFDDHKNPVANIEFSVASADDLSSFSARSFDAITMSFVLMFVKDKAKSIKEIQRVLKPGGKAYIAVWKSMDFVDLSEGSLVKLAGPENYEDPEIDPTSLKADGAVEEIVAGVAGSERSLLVSRTHELAYNFELGIGSEACSAAMILVGSRIEKLVESGKWKNSGMGASEAYCQIFEKQLNHAGYMDKHDETFTIDHDKIKAQIITLVKPMSGDEL